MRRSKAQRLWELIKDDAVSLSDEKALRVIPAWHSANCCGKDEKVRHKGKIWASVTESNTCEAGVYGWEEVS